ncbi:hypothetical protein JB92DRAFT_1677592 [Gautieria morchelliformis]|nr:hypothetical protein JB92DRAFT_1677592 [Gautieria morchelliformis]
MAFELSLYLFIFWGGCLAEVMGYLRPETQNCLRTSYHTGDHCRPIPLPDQNWTSVSCLSWFVSLKDCVPAHSVIVADVTTLPIPNLQSSLLPGTTISPFCGIMLSYWVSRLCSS